ncbi:MAG TPA: SIS domain-containing protein [Bryobacteraceae bacterium]|nr:SIS domain-containing protein [Bryobacteraceae bacterium]
MKPAPLPTACASALRLAEIAQMFWQAAECAFPQAIEAAAAAIGEAIEKGGKVLAFGNGGSAADAQHFCGELMVRFQRERRALPAIALVSDAAVLTACANDYEYEEVFARQMEALGKPGDIALAISTSGESANVVRALEVARRQGLQTILLTGAEAGAAARFADLVVAAPAAATARIQELHLAAYHLICERLDARFASA